MRWVFACIGLVCAARALAEQPAAPFAPFPTVADYVVTMVGDHGQPREYVRTVMHHGAWTRVDHKSIFHHTTAYFSPAGSIDIQLHRSARANNEVVSAWFVRSDIRPVGWGYEPRNTGERQTVLGETCTVWNVDPVRSSCITDDGIELWSKVVFGGYEILSSVEATRIERRPIAPDDVMPDDARRARDLLALGPWLRPAATSADIPEGADYEVVMQAQTLRDSTPLIRTTRRHGGWTYVEETSGGARRQLTIENQGARFRMQYIMKDTDSLERLNLSRLPDEPARAPTGAVPKDMTRAEQVLGETCEWFDVWPGTMDGGLEECRTSDGITLKSALYGWGDSSDTFTAVRFARRPLSLQQVMPPPELFDPKHWGLD